MALVSTVYNRSSCMQVRHVNLFLCNNVTHVQPTLILEGRAIFLHPSVMKNRRLGLSCLLEISINPALARRAWKISQRGRDVRYNSGEQSPQKQGADSNAKGKKRVQEAQCRHLFLLLLGAKTTGSRWTRQ